MTMDESASARCSFCPTEIPMKEFEEARAVKIAGRNYCQQCMTAAIEKGKNPDRFPDHHAPQPIQPLVPPERRRNERKEKVLFLELSIYLANGRLHHRGAVLMRNVSLSGALLGGLVLPTERIPAEPHRIGIRLLEGPLKDQEILCRVVRYIHRSEGSEVALEFEGTETAKVELLRKII
jgi:hypothetical protein